MNDIYSDIHSIFSNCKSIGVASHDAGASEIISEICLLLEQDVVISYCLSGPAIEIFKRKSLNVNNNVELEKIMNSDLILTGTGWETEVELLSLETAKKNHIPCYVVLDHFQHFRSRFKKQEGQYIFPDKIIVTNLYTHHVVKNEIPEVPVIHTDDIYIESLLKSTKALSKNLKKQKSEILYLSDGQPYNQKSRYSQISQISKIEKNYKQIVKFVGKDFSKISIRPHPADVNNNKAPTKLEWMHFEEVHGSLDSLINKSILVIGTDSLAMYAAMRLGARTLTLIHENEKPVWLDFAVTLESLGQNNNLESINNIFLFDDQTGTYVRKFSLLDIDILHLTNKGISFAKEFNSTLTVYNSFESYFDQVYKKLAKDRMHFSVMNCKNIRIGIVAVRFYAENHIITLTPFIYSEMNDEKNFNSGIELLSNSLKINFVNYEIKIEK